ncbi:MAG: hypothetical protein WC829_01060 [Hyphomicrobium sp.]
MSVDVSPKAPQEETYMGDGVYASFDGYQIKLRAPRAEGDHEIYLEPGVYGAVRAYGAKIWELKP